MQLFILAICTLFILDQSNGQLEDVDVIRSEMDQSMEKFAVGETLVLLSKNLDMSKVSTSLIEIMNNKYGRDWVTLIGTNLHPLIIGLNIVDKTFLLMEYKDNHVVLFRQKIEQGGNETETSIKDIIKRARASGAKLINTSYRGRYDTFTQLAKQIVANDYDSCDSNTDSNEITNWCYREMSVALVDAINNKTNGDGVYTATIGNTNRCFSESLGLNITEAHLFTLDSIYFEIRKYKL